jgi:hypothetical protein
VEPSDPELFELLGDEGYMAYQATP